MRCVASGGSARAGAAPVVGPADGLDDPGARLHCSPPVPVPHRHPLGARYNGRPHTVVAGRLRSRRFVPPCRRAAVPPRDSGSRASYLISGSRGSPRMRSAIWLRVISDVPPAIDIALVASWGTRPSRRRPRGGRWPRRRGPPAGGHGRGRAPPAPVWSRCPRARGRIPRRRAGPAGGSAPSRRAPCSRWRRRAAAPGTRSPPLLRRASRSMGGKMPPTPPPMDTRSLPRVERATAHPSSGVPTTSSSGTNTSSKKTSLKSALPVICRSGRTSTPGACMSMTIVVMPACLGASGFVRTVASPRSQYWAPLVHTFWPLTFQPPRPASPSS